MATRRNKPEQPWPPLSTGNHVLDQAINSEIALFNNTENVFGFWSLLDRCLSENVPIPDGARKELREIAAAIAEVGRKGSAGARAELSDIILNTNNNAGGNSQFEEYAAYKRISQIIERARELIIDDQRASEGRREKRRPQMYFYEIVAKQFGIEPETVKRYVEVDNLEAGSFALKVLSGPPGEV